MNIFRKRLLTVALISCCMESMESSPLFAQRSMGLRIMPPGIGLSMRPPGIGPSMDMLRDIGPSMGWPTFPIRGIRVSIGRLYTYSRELHITYSDTSQDRQTALNNTKKGAYSDFNRQLSNLFSGKVDIQSDSLMMAQFTRVSQAVIDSILAENDVALTELLDDSIQIYKAKISIVVSKESAIQALIKQTKKLLNALDLKNEDEERIVENLLNALQTLLAEENRKSSRRLFSSVYNYEPAFSPNIWGYSLGLSSSYFFAEVPLLSLYPPRFPLPFPKPTASVHINVEALNGGVRPTTLGEVSSIIVHLLEEAGYDNMSFLYVPSDLGFAIVTQFQQITFSGLYPEELEYQQAKTIRLQAVIDFFKEILRGHPGHYRNFVFLVTKWSEAFPSSVEIDYDEAEEWLLGLKELPLPLRTQVFSSDHTVTGLIYDFMQTELDSTAKLISPSEISVKNYFGQAGLGKLVGSKK